MMKRTLWILLCFTLLLNAAGCGIGSLSSGNAVIPTAAPTSPTQATEPTVQETVETTAPTQATEPLPAEPPVSSYQIPLTVIATPQVTEADTMENGDAVFTYSYPNITFLHQDTAVARSVLLDLRNRVEAARADAKSLQAHASELAQSTAAAPGHFMNVTCEATRVDQSILSVLFLRRVKTDTKTGTVSKQGLTYDLASGKPITLSQLLAEDANADLLQTLLADALSGKNGLYSWYGDILQELFTGNALPENWYLSHEGLCFYFMPYEISPSSVEVCITYAQLNGVIRDRYYLPEAPDPVGVLEVIPFENADLSRFTAFAELALDDVDSAYLLYPSNAVTQLRIFQTEYDRDSESYRPSCLVFATDFLTADQAIRLQYVFSAEQLPLHICYEADGESHTLFLRLNSADGSIALTE